MARQWEEDLADELAHRLEVAINELIEAENVADQLVDEGGSEDLLDLAVSGQWEFEAARDAIADEYGV